MAVDGYLNFDTRINTKGFSGGVKRLGGQLDTLKSQISGVAKAAAAAFSVSAAVSFGRSAVEAAAAVNAENSALTQTFGTLEQSAREAFSRVAADSGILETRLHGVGTQIFAFAKTAGMDSASALAMTEDALRAAADSAAYYDRSLEDVSESLRSFLKGNYANDAALGVSATETTRNAAAMRLYGKAFRDLSEAQKQLTLLQMVRDANALSGAEGQAAREAQGWENVIGNLKEAWRQFTAAAGQPLLRVVIPAVQQLTAWLAALTNAAQSAFGALSAVMGGEADQSAQTAQTAQNISAAVDAQDALTAATEETAKAQADLTGFDELHKLSEPDAAAPETDTPSAAVSLMPSADVQTFTKDADALTERISQLLEPVKIAWDANAPALLDSAQRARSELLGLFSGIGQSLAAVWTNGSGERLVGNLITGFTDLVGIVGDLSGALAEAWEDGGAGTAFVQSVFDRWNSLLELIHAVTDAARTAWNGGAGAAILGDILGILTDINNTWTNLREQFTAAWQENSIGVSIFEHIFGIIRRITGTFRRMSSATAKWAKQLDFSPILTAFDGLLDAIEPLVDTIGGALADAYEDVLLPLGKWAIEKAAPAAIDLLSGAVSALTAVIDAVKPAAKWLWDEFLQPIAKWTGGAIVFVLGVLSEALRNIADWISRHQTLVQGFAVVIGSLAAAFALVNGAIAAWTAISGIASAATTALGAAFAFLTSPIGLVVLAVGAIIAAGVLLVKHWDEIKQFAIDMWAEIERVLRGFVDKVVSIYDSLVNFLKGCWLAIKAVFAGVGKWFSARFREAWEAITGIFSAIGKWFSDRWNDIKRAFSAVGKWFRDLFQKAWDAITGIFSAIGAWFGKRWEDIKRVFAAVGKWYGDRFREAWDAVTGIFSAVGSWFGARWQEIKNVFAAVGSFFSGVFTGGWEAVKSAFSGVKRWFSDRWEDVKSVFSGVGTWFSEKFQAAYDGITGIFSKLGGFFDNIWGGVKTVLNSVLSGIESMLNGIVNAANKVIGFLNGFSVDIPSWVPSIGGNSIGFDFKPLEQVKLPRLATGTVIPANYGEFAAILGDNRREPEIVSPVGAMKQAFLEALAEQTAGGDQTIVVQLMCDGRKLAEIVRKYNLSGARATNGGVR